MALIWLKRADIVSVTTSDQECKSNYAGTMTNNGHVIVYYQLNAATVTANDTRNPDGDKGRIYPKESVRLFDNRGEPMWAAFKTATGTAILDWKSE